MKSSSRDKRIKARSFSGGGGEKSLFLSCPRIGVSSLCTLCHMCREGERKRKVASFFVLFFLFSSSGGWGKIKLKLTTRPRFFTHVACRFNSIVFAIQR